VTYAADQSCDSTRGFATRAVHAGERAARPAFVPTSTPIYGATSFLHESMDTLDAVLGGEDPGFAYTRYGNPTTRALEVAVAALEGTEDAIAFGSGMAALHAAILNEVKTGSKIVAATDLYGSTAQLLTTVFKSLGVETIFVNVLDLERLRSTVDETKPRIVLCETISNPLLHVADLAAIVEIAQSNESVVVCDNTFASPVMVNPARFGVDTVVHSSTKYLGGHGDVTGGIVATTSERGFELRELTKLVGGIPGPFESWLTLRGIKTLPLRVRQQSENAAEIVQFLCNHPGSSACTGRVYTEIPLTWCSTTPFVVGWSPLKSGMRAETRSFDFWRPCRSFCQAPLWGMSTAWRSIRRFLLTAAWTGRSVKQPASTTVWCGSRPVSRTLQT